MVDAGTRRLAQLPRFPPARHRPRADPRPGVPQHRRRRHGERRRRERPRPTWTPRPRPRWRKAHPDVVVGFKTAHYAAEGLAASTARSKAGKLANLPVMVDFGYVRRSATSTTLLRDKLRPGDIYTHCYSGRMRDELTSSGKVNPAMLRGRASAASSSTSGHGGGSFLLEHRRARHRSRASCRTPSPPTCTPAA